MLSNIEKQIDKPEKRAHQINKMKHFQKSQKITIGGLICVSDNKPTLSPIQNKIIKYKLLFYFLDRFS